MEKFYITQKNNIWYGCFDIFSKYGFINACSCRLNGKSIIHKDMFNLALHVNDDTDLVVENRKRFAETIGVDADRFTTCEQIHGAEVAVVDENLVGSGCKSFTDSIAKTDALITNLNNVPLLLFFADCVPVLLADIKTGCIGLVHAGWRGSVAEIAAKTVKKMQKEFGCLPENIIAGIAPSIGSCCYEVDNFVYSKAVKYQDCFIKKSSGKYHLDLWKMNYIQLKNCGLLDEHIVIAGVCTHHNNKLFCSYRAENGKTGRMGVCLCKK